MRKVELVLALGAIACAPTESSGNRVGDEPADARATGFVERVDADAFIPLWYPGDRWVARFGDGPGAGVIDMPGISRESQWEFTVDAVADGKVRVTALELGDDPSRFGNRRELVFDSAGRMLEAGWVGDFLYPVGELPRIKLGIDGTGTFNEAWPIFPLRDFGGDDEEIRQRVVRTAKGYRVEVTETVPVHEAIVRTTMVQVWEAGRPWWSAFTIDRTREVGGVRKPGDGVLQFGEVTQWGGKAVDR